MPSPQAPLPTFLIIGAQKSATRWLRHNLGLHPAVFTADHELAFFNRWRYHQLGLDWYRAQFEGWAGEPIVGEATPGYMILHHRPPMVARRIHDTVPDVRLIAVLRNPIDRANSAMWHHKRRGRIRSDVKLLDHVRARPPEEDQYAVITGGWYATCLRPYRQLFGEQLLVLLHDDVRDDPSGVYRRALQHIGADANHEPPRLDEVVFSNQRSAGRRRYELSPEERIELYEYFRDEIRKVELMFDLDLSIWRPDGYVGPLASELIERYDVANAWIETIVGNLETAQLETATGEPGVTVRMLVERLVGTALYFWAVLDRAPLSDPRTPAERAAFASDPVAGYRHAASLLRAAIASAANLEGTVPIPTGRGAAEAAAAAALTNQLAVGWEIAGSTGQLTDLPARLVESAAASARDMVAWLPSPAASSNGASAESSTTLVERFLSSLDAAARRSAP